MQETATATDARLDPAVGEAASCRARTSMQVGGPWLFAPALLLAILALPEASAGASACTEDGQTLCLTGKRFRVAVDWRDFDGHTGAGTAVPLTGDTGSFWFFDDANLELVVKVLDGRSLNDHFWVYYGALSNVAFELVVTDTETGASHTYGNPLGTFASVGDTEALPGTSAAATLTKAPDLDAPELHLATKAVPSGGTSVRAPLAAGEILHDQLDHAAGGAISSQDFGAARDGYDSEAADDFDVPAGERWRIDSIELSGAADGPGTLTATIYRNNGGLPGEEVFRAGGLTPDPGLDSSGAIVTYRIDLPTPPLLDGGSYWLSVQGVLDDPDQWYWRERTEQRLSESAWRNPPGQFVPACRDWGRRLTDCGAGNDPDLMFRLLGESMAATGCRPDTDTLCLGAGRFEVRVGWTDFKANAGAGRAVPITDDTGAFWFFDSANLELMVKVLDGRSINDFFWVFYGALTNVAFEMTVTDTETGRRQVYRNPIGEFASQGDTQAIDGRPPATTAGLIAALEGAGFDTVSSSGPTVDRPLLLVPSLQDGPGVLGLLQRESACRDEAHDAFFHLAVTDAGGYRPVGELVDAVRAGLRAAWQAGVRDVTVIGHNTGGLVARAALSVEGGRALPDGLRVRLITFYTPFAGIADGERPAGYPVELGRGHPFVAAPGALAGIASHFLVTGRRQEGVGNDLEGPSDVDALFFDAQSQPSVTTDPRVVGTYEMDLSFWAISLDRSLARAFDAAGYPPSHCENVASGSARAESATRDRSSASSAPHASARAGIGQRTDVPYDPKEHAAKGLTRMNPSPVTVPGTIDPDKPITLLVHGFDFDLSRDSYFTHPARRLGEAGENVFLFQYDYENENLDQAADRLIAAVCFLYEKYHRHQITIIGHSMGGLVSRRGLTQGRALDLSGKQLDVVLVTVASPFAGSDAADFFPDWMVRFSGEAAVQMASGGSFILSPGVLLPNVTHFKFVTREEDHPDDVLSIAEQTNPAIDDDPRLIGAFTLDNGHVSVLGSDITWNQIIAVTQYARGLNPLIVGEDGSEDTDPTVPLGDTLQVRAHMLLGETPCPLEVGSLLISNAGMEGFLFQLQQDPSETFSLSLTSTSLNPGQSTRVDILFDCSKITGPGLYHHFIDAEFTHEGRIARRRIQVTVDVDRP